MRFNKISTYLFVFIVGLVSITAYSDSYTKIVEVGNVGSSMNYTNLALTNKSNIFTGNISAPYFMGKVNLSDVVGYSAGVVNRSYYYNKTYLTLNGAYGGYINLTNVCNGEFTGSHICTVNEILDTIIYLNVSDLPNWGGTAWIIDGPPGYLADANDCLGFTSSSNQDLGRFWNFDDTTEAGMGWLVNCASLKSLACCKVGG